MSYSVDLPPDNDFEFDREEDEAGKFQKVNSQS